MVGYIYKIENLVNSKVYIGSTGNLSRILEGNIELLN